MENRIPSRFKHGDNVILSFAGSGMIKNCKISGIKFDIGKVRYDVTIRMKIDEKVYFANLVDVDSAFVSEAVNVPRSYESEDVIIDAELFEHKEESRNPTLQELKDILVKMDFYKKEAGFIAPVWGGVLTFFEEEPTFGGIPITRDEVLKGINE